MNFFVTATVRERACDRSAAVIALQLDKLLDGFTIHNLKDLVGLSNSHQLWVNVGQGVPPVRVEVFWSPDHRRHTARSAPDFTRRNNLDHLPIVRPRSDQITPGATNYEACSI